MYPLALIVCIIGGIVAIAASRPGRLSDGMIADLGKWSFVVGLFFWLWSVAK